MANPDVRLIPDVRGISNRLRLLLRLMLCEDSANHSIISLIFGVIFTSESVLKVGGAT